MHHHAEQIITLITVVVSGTIFRNPFKASGSNALLSPARILSTILSIGLKTKRKVNIMVDGNLHN